MLKIIKVPAERVLELRRLQDAVNAAKLAFGALKDATRRELSVDPKEDFDDTLEYIVVKREAPQTPTATPIASRAIWARSNPSASR